MNPAHMQEPRPVLPGGEPAPHHTPRHRHTQQETGDFDAYLIIPQKCEDDRAKALSSYGNLTRTRFNLQRQGTSRLMRQQSSRRAPSPSPQPSPFGASVPHRFTDSGDTDTRYETGANRFFDPSTSPGSRALAERVAPYLQPLSDRDLAELAGHLHDVARRLPLPLMSELCHEAALWLSFRRWQGEGSTTPAADYAVVGGAR
jgi:hypothetical protein